MGVSLVMQEPSVTTVPCWKSGFAVYLKFKKFGYQQDAGGANKFSLGRNRGLPTGSLVPGLFH